jgi:predicted DNA-binding transcriptional regulator AlpA
MAEQQASLLLNEHRAAERLGLAVATLRRWRWAGKGPKFRKLGAAVRYSEADLAAFIEAGERHSTSDPGPEADRA